MSVAMTGLTAVVGALLLVAAAWAYAPERRWPAVVGIALALAGIATSCALFASLPRAPDNAVWTLGERILLLALVLCWVGVALKLTWGRKVGSNSDAASLLASG